MNKANVEALKTRLVALGFEHAVESVLWCNVCFSPAAFEVCHSLANGVDHCSFVAHVERGAADDYAIRYYTASLRKPVVVPAELSALDASMGSVDWKLLVAGKSFPVEISGDHVMRASDVLGELARVGVAADVLKYKRWVGTVMEPMIGNLSVMRSEYEISERFYLLDEAEPITFTEAVRFLNSRWAEKQMLARKKLLVKKSPGDKNSGAVSGGKLLSKNPRKAQRRSVS